MVGCLKCRCQSWDNSQNVPGEWVTEMVWRKIPVEVRRSSNREPRELKSHPRDFLGDPV